jgi:hypothetical protein
MDTVFPIRISFSVLTVPDPPPHHTDCSDMVTHSQLLCAGSNDVCVELRGPAFESTGWSIPVLITVPHGGSLNPNNYVERDCDANSGWVCSADSYTRQLSEVLAARFGAGYSGKCPWVVINHLHRSRLDANREINEATGGDANAALSHTAFHQFITDGQVKMNTIHGNDGSGIKGLLFDLHGYKGTDWRAGGAPYAMFGYRLLGSTLQSDPLPDAPSGGLTHAKNKLGANSLENLVRGPLSMGNRVPQVDGTLLVNDVPNDCGLAMPSPAIRKPLDLCPACHYFSGGYDLAEHETNVVGTLDMNVMQLEAPRCIRGAFNWYTATQAETDAIRADYGDKLAAGLCGWLTGVFNENLC